MSTCKTCPSNNRCTKDKNNCSIKNNPLNNVKRVIGVMSGKGGVGKSSISAIIAKQLNELGYKVGILDADITGPSIPRLMRVSQEKANIKNDTIIPVVNGDGIKVMSLNFLIENESDPVIWRGPMISGLVEQFWKDVLWGELDYLIIDMPPGTGDVALTVMKSIPINGLVMVSIPQNLVSMIVSKAVNMAKTMKIDVLGLVENMSYVMCPDCDKEIRIFENNDSEKYLKDMDLELLGSFPMTQDLSNISKNKLDEKVNKELKDMTEKVLNKLK